MARSDPETNGGFAAGNNLGLAWALGRPSRADLFWLLNPDTEVLPMAAAFDEGVEKFKKRIREEVE